VLDIKPVIGLKEISRLWCLLKRSQIDKADRVSSSEPRKGTRLHFRSLRFRDSHTKQPNESKRVQVFALSALQQPHVRIACLQIEELHEGVGQNAFLVRAQEYAAMVLACNIPACNPTEHGFHPGTKILANLGIPLVKQPVMKDLKHASIALIPGIVSAQSNAGICFRFH
jgi:hypothetical protein